MTTTKTVWHTTKHGQFATHFRASSNRFTGEHLWTTMVWVAVPDGGDVQSCLSLVAPRTVSDADLMTAFDAAYAARIAA